MQEGGQDRAPGHHAHWRPGPLRGGKGCSEAPGKEESEKVYSLDSILSAQACLGFSSVGLTGELVRHAGAPPPPAQTLRARICISTSPGDSSAELRAPPPRGTFLKCCGTCRRGPKVSSLSQVQLMSLSQPGWGGSPPKGEAVLAPRDPCSQTLPEAEGGAAPGRRPCPPVGRACPSL